MKKPNYFLQKFIAMLGTGCFDEPFEKAKKQGYSTISPEEAKEMMESSVNAVVLDIRTELEFNFEHIESAVCVPPECVLELLPELAPQKDTKILLYCRSGRRSAIAAQELVQMGYTNIYDFGGIIDWPYETIEQ